MLCRFIPLNSTVAGAANLPNMENFSVFAVSGFQYIFMAIIVTKGYPYKKPLYANGKKGHSDLVSLTSVSQLFCPAYIYTCIMDQFQNH